MATVEDAAEVAGDADRPGQRGRLQAGALADLVHQLEGVVARPVPLVDHGDDRDAPVPADLEQLHRLRLEALGGVDQHHGGVDRGQHPVGVLGEVGVAGGVDQVDHGVAVAELQGGRGDRDAALALHVHPVGHGAAAAVLAVHGAGRAITRACRARASVSVDLPASGWLITANERRREASVVASEGAVRATPVALIGSVRPATSRVPPHCARHRGHQPVATAMVRPRRAWSGIGGTGHRAGSGPAGGLRRPGPAGAQGCSASNSASATTSSSASRRMWPRTAWSRRMIRAALSPQVDR